MWISWSSSRVRVGAGFRDASYRRYNTYFRPNTNVRDRSRNKPPPPPLTYIPEILTIVRNGWVRRHCRREVSSGAVPTDDGRTNTYPAKLVCVLQVER